MRRKKLQISGVITTAQFKPTKNDPSKNTMVFSVAPDDGGKHEDFYANNTQLQAEVTANLNRHVTIEYTMNGKWKNIQSITESEAPIPPNHAPIPPTDLVTIAKQVETKQTDWDMIGRQKARCSILQSFCNFFSGSSEVTSVKDIISACEDGEAYVFSPMPSKEPTFIKKAPEPSVVMANKAQIFNLKKFVKSKNDADLLVQAEGRVGRDLASLEELTLDEADEWLNEVKKK